MTSIASALSFQHRFVPVKEGGRPPLLLLHGTGGNEDDLVPFGHAVAPGAALLSPLGQVLEHGMPRFFRRLAEGVFDEDDLRRRTDDLARFVAEARTEYGLAAPIAVGFSNGANIAAAMLMLYPNVLAGAVLLRAMLPLRTMPDVRLAATPVLLLSGIADPIILADHSTQLASALYKAGARLTHRELPGGHGLGQRDVDLTRDWLASIV